MHDAVSSLAKTASHIYITSVTNWMPISRLHHCTTTSA